MSERESLIWSIRDIINNDGCPHCFQVYIKQELGRYNKNIENEIVYLLTNGEKDIKEKLFNIITNMPSWLFKSEEIIDIIKKENEYDNLDYESLYD